MISSCSRIFKCWRWTHVLSAWIAMWYLTASYPPWMCVCLCCLSQGIWPLLPLPESLYRPVDSFSLSTTGGHRCQLACLLHHTLHWGSFRCTDLHHLHLRGSGEADPPGSALPHQQTQQPSDTHTVLVKCTIRILKDWFFLGSWRPHLSLKLSGPLFLLLLSTVAHSHKRACVSPHHQTTDGAAVWQTHCPVFQ